LTLRVDVNGLDPAGPVRCGDLPILFVVLVFGQVRRAARFSARSADLAEGHRWQVSTSLKTCHNGGSAPFIVTVTRRDEGLHNGENTERA